MGASRRATTEGPGRAPPSQGTKHHPMPRFVARERFGLRPDRSRDHPLSRAASLAGSIPSASATSIFAGWLRRENIAKRFTQLAIASGDHLSVQSRCQVSGVQAKPGRT
jgi:hypothetical protein